MHQTLATICCLLTTTWPLTATTPATTSGSPESGFAARINATTRNRGKSTVAVTIAREGKALLPILTGVKPQPEVTEAADELAATLEKITGGKFEVRTAAVTDTGPAIRVGTIKDFPTPSATEGLRIYNFYDGKEAYAVRTDKDGIRLLGATPPAVGYAVSRFLQLLGCRWFLQNPVWTVIPQQANLSFALNETDRPDLLRRYWGHPVHQGFEPDDPDSGKALIDWWRRNRVGKSFQTEVGHCWPEVIERFPEEFKAHPEYLAEVNGKRQGPQLCISNPAVIKLAIALTREKFDRNPDRDMVGVGPADGGNYCTCAACKAKFAAPGDMAFYLANEVGKAVQASHPGKFVGIYAYNWHCDPPPFKLASNVYVELTSALLIETKYGFEKLLEMWPKTASYVGIYDYWACYDWTRDALGAGRTCNLDYVTQKLPEYMRHGISVMTSEAGTSWAVHGLGYYLASRICWDRKVNIPAVLDDFYNKAFGPAAATMRRYYEAASPSSLPLTGPTYHRMLLDLLDEAKQQAAGQPEVLARIESLRDYQVYWYLYQRANELGGTDASRQNYAYHMAGWNYHIRNSYMTFWGFFVDQTLRQLRDRYNEPTWDFYGMLQAGKAAEIPWRKAEERAGWRDRESWLQEARGWYGPGEMPRDISWGGELVAPAGLQGPTHKIHPLLSQGGALLAVQVPPGEPLRFKAAQATIYPNSPPGPWEVMDQQGKKVASGEVPAGERALEIKVPKAGIYYLRYEDHAGGWAFTADETQKTAAILERAERLNFYRHSGFYFYVPKGTREIQFHSLSTNWFAIWQPDGKPAGKPRLENNPGNQHLSFTGNGRVTTIPVPEGMDGKLWSTQDLLSNTLHFFNCPNIFFLRPSDAMIPRELAVKDGWLD